MTAQRRQWGINIASLLPWSWGPAGPRRAWQIARKAGFDGLQILPFRGWDRPEVAIPTQSVISLESAWNTGPLSRALLRAIGRLDHPHPTIKDWLLFGASRERCHDWQLRAARHFRRAILSQHVVGGWHSHPIEIHPELGLSLDQYRAYPGGLVWDTRQVRRRGRDGALPPVTADWRGFLDGLAHHQIIRLIHINTTTDEVVEAAWHRETEFVAMLQRLARATPMSCPVILELAPKPFWSPGKLAGYLAGIRSGLASEYFKA